MGGEYAEERIAIDSFKPKSKSVLYAFLRVRDQLQRPSAIALNDDSGTLREYFRQQRGQARSQRVGRGVWRIDEDELVGLTAQGRRLEEFERVDGVHSRLLLVGPDRLEICLHDPYC